MADETNSVADATIPVEGGEDQNGQTVLDLALDQVPDFDVVEEGEHEVVVEKAVLGKSKKDGSPYLMLHHAVVGVPNSKSFTNVMMLPNANDDARTRLQKLDRIKKACQAFGLPIDKSFVPDDFVGQTTWAILGIEDGGDQYGQQNRIQRYIGSR